MQEKKKESQKNTGVPDFPQNEEDVLSFWDREGIFAQTLEKTKNGDPFVFYEGPPTANGKPGIHHILARAFKDVVVRYQTMNGRFVSRRAGWDTHGLPVELAVEKELGISGKKDIENIVSGDTRASIAEFNAKCKANVMSLIVDWEKMTRRIGYWLDFENAYRTYTNDYVETLWWIIKEMSTKTTDEGPLLYKGHKVVPHCPRCETALSSHEVAQGYKTVQDTSVYVKFTLRETNLLKAQSFIDNKESVYILSWTTTPWTLPGNVALAIKEDMRYVMIKHEKEHLILAKDLYARVLGEDAEVELEFRGKDLLDSKYEPLFSGAVDAAGHPNAWKVLSADFVTAEDGTGVVHTAVMYGEDDYQLGLAQKLPTQHTVDASGHFSESVEGLSGMFVKDEKTEKKILDLLHEQNLLLKVEPYTHEYPFCWRCSTPLLYYAKDSWYVRMSAFRNALEASNKTINWIPEHIRDGRFGEWLREAKDWAFSRERYWGTPLPIWECGACGKIEVIGSLSELQKRATDNSLPEDVRTIYMLRHGESEKNKPKDVISADITKDSYHLTDNGKKQAQDTAKQLKGKVDIIVTSDFVRTRETADIVAKETGAEVITDFRLRELHIESFEGRETPIKEVEEAFPKYSMRIHEALPGWETLASAAKRMQEAVIDNLQRFEGKRIAFISHGDPIFAYQWLLSNKKPEAINSMSYPAVGVANQLKVKNIPLNPHRPYIDSIELACSCTKRGVMRRVEEVADVWFDSGAMPFAQNHYPFDNSKGVEDGSLYPADYISEAIDQTRGWFYTLLAVATVLEKHAPYKNVICLGHILDEKGEKMSKSKGNIVDPWEVIARTGSDALRFYFYSMNQPGDAKLFSTEGVEEVVKKVFMILWNVQSFYLLYAKPGIISVPPASSHPLDQWLLARLEQVRVQVTDGLTQYSIFDAARALRDCIQDLSTWYVRRSRDRIKAGDDSAKETLGFAISLLAQLLAPLTPLFAESVYLRQKGRTKGPASIHLTDWPSEQIPCNKSLLEEMSRARQVVEMIHSIRKEKQMKSRQPLATAQTTQKISDALLEIIAQEVNVDSVVSVSSVDASWPQQEKNGVTVALDTNLTPELEQRGLSREFLRHVNDLRKLARLTPDDSITLYLEAPKGVATLAKDIHEELKETARVEEVVFEIPSSVEVKKIAKINGQKITLGLIVR